jgi:hypothetical protein
MTTPKIGAPELAPCQGGLRYLEQGARFYVVKDKDLTAPPGSPADGDAYVVAASPTGAWSGWAGRVAFRMGSVWQCVVPEAGVFAYVQDESQLYTYGGSVWAVFAPAVSEREVEFLVTDPQGSAIIIGDGATYFRVPASLDGMNLVAVAAALTAASSSGTPTIQIANVTRGVDMLSTKLTIDVGETDSSTAAVAAVIDTGHDDVSTADMLRIDIYVAGTGAKGLIVNLTFQLP